MRAIVEAGTGLEVAAVISNRPDAKGLEWARAHGLPTRVVDHKEHGTREAFDGALAEALEGYQPDLILLAGFMRIFTAGFIQRFPRRIVNIHPSLLPSFPGLHTHRQALAAGVKVHGATVHVVTPALDNGPIVIQGAVPVLEEDTEDALAERVLQVEHRIYPQAVRWFVEGRVAIADDGIVQVRDAGVADEYLISPRNRQ
jgi:phosphoribosylglycinamide formyltransferase-1